MVSSRLPVSHFGALRHAQRSLRRGLFRVGAASILGLSLPELLAVQAETLRRVGRAKNVLVILEQGGLSHIDTWDPKPEVVAEHRSPHRPIATSVPGIRFTDLLAPSAASPTSSPSSARCATPRPAPTAIRSAPSTPLRLRPRRGRDARHRLDVAHRWARVPIGCRRTSWCRATTNKTRDSPRGFLSANTKVFKTGGGDLSDPTWKVTTWPDAGVDEGRFHDRLDPPTTSARLRRRRDQHAEPCRPCSVYEQATDMLSNPRVAGRFKLADESDAVRDAYGRGHRGACYLLGRKLIEAGVRFVTVDVRWPHDARTPGGFNLNWDHHDYMYHAGSCGTVRNAAGGEGRYGIGHWVMMGTTDRRSPRSSAISTSAACSTRRSSAS